MARLTSTDGSFLKVQRVYAILSKANKSCVIERMQSTKPIMDDP